MVHFIDQVFFAGADKENVVLLWPLKTVSFDCPSNPFFFLAEYKLCHNLIRPVGAF